MNRSDRHQPAPATASHAYAAYLAKQEAADAAREVCEELGIRGDWNAYLDLAEEAEAAYAECQAAWARENHAQAEADDPEPEPGHEAEAGQ